jgi:Tfp pilus assembly protein PilF
MYNLSLALDRKQDYQAEGEVLESAIKVDPGFATAHNQLGFLKFQAGKLDDAEKEFTAALSLNPHYAEAQNNLGSLYGQQEKSKDAELLFRQAIENNPTYVQAFVNLAVTLASQSRLTEAESELEKALRIEPDNEHAREVQTQIKAQIAQRGKLAK